MAGADQGSDISPSSDTPPSFDKHFSLSDSLPLNNAVCVASPPPSMPTHDINAISRLANDILPSIAAARPRSAISIWCPRQEPAKRATSRLKKCNAAFLALCDAVSFKNGECESVLVLTPVFLNEETAKEVREATERGMFIMDAMHKGELDTAADNLLHISRVGRKTAVFVEFFAIRDGQRLIEFISIETPLNPSFFRPGDRINHAELLLSDSTPLLSPWEIREEVHAGPCTFVLRGAVRKELQWRVASIKQLSRAMLPNSVLFVCDFCSSRHTTQRRYAALSFAQKLWPLLFWSLKFRSRFSD